jgi:hypothetical protein
VTAIALARAGASFLFVFLWDGSGAPPTWLGSLESAAARSGSVVVWATDALPAPLAHGSSLTLTLARTQWVWEQGQLLGLRTAVRCVKNKVSAVAGLVGSEVEAQLEIRYPVGAELFPDAPLDVVAISEAEARAWQARSAAG